MKKLSYLIFILSGALLYACTKENDTAEITKPLVVMDVAKDTVTVGGTSVIVGPLKDYEQASDVVYKFTVTTEKPLTKFFVSSSSDAVSQLSKVLKTEPENAIDATGKFTTSLKNVTVYYSYRIDPLVPAASNVTLSFNFQNEDNYVGIISHSFTVIKAGSTSGKPLRVLDLPFAYKVQRGIGTQDNFNIVSGIRGEANVRLSNRRAPFYSTELFMDLGWVPEDVYANVDKIDFVGFRPRFASTSPALTVGQFYLVSPSNIPVLTHTYPGSATIVMQLVGTSGSGEITAAGLTRPVTFTTNLNTTATNFVNANKAAYTALGLNLTTSGANMTWTVVTTNPAVNYANATFVNKTGDLAGNQFSASGNNQLSDIKVVQMRETVNKMAAMAQASGVPLRTVYFKRLDNISGPNRVTPEYFGTLTHDNEFAALTAGIQAEGKTAIGPLSFNEVYGFVMSDGRKGLIKTTANTYFNTLTNATAPVDAPSSGDFVLYCTIKIQQK
ncbi:hypothetical protein [Hufsiella ginkgonis]|uniref:DUF4270 family protein n=1 Tax=Hufsiella ginkgonis TaxID=2695274 RepID=A0A7K1Y343_9SPHI|nr:hypothetical protein [Hufsiella ginkgonis]MXV17661.1 hypothetical protein [Hufsiella ginkgonis]